MLTSRDIERILDQNNDKMITSLKSAINGLQRAMEDAVFSKITTKGNSIPNIENNIQYLNGSYNELLKTLNNSGYDNAVREVIANETDMIKQIKALYAKSSFPMEFTSINTQSLSALQQQQFAYFHNLGVNAVNSIQKALVDSIIGASETSYLIQTIQDELGDKLARYATTYFQTAKNQLLQDVQEMSANNYRDAGVEIYWEYRGPDDIKTRDECNWALSKRVFTDEEYQEFLSGGGYPHTEPRWNCRHVFVMIDKKLYDKKESGAESRIDNRNFPKS